MAKVFKLDKRLKYLKKVNHAIRLLYPNIPGWILFRDGNAFCLKHFQFDNIFRATDKKGLKNLILGIRNGDIFLYGKNPNGVNGGLWGKKPSGIGNIEYAPLTKEEMKFACKPDVYVFEGEDPIPCGPLFSRTVPKGISDTDEEVSAPWQSIARRIYEDVR